MKNGLSGLKNFIWAAAILAVLLALLVGMVFAMSAGFQGERDSGTMTLGETVRREKNTSGVDGGLDAAPAVLRELPATQKSTLEAVFNMTFLVDKTVMGLRTYCENLPTVRTMPQFNFFHRSVEKNAVLSSTCSSPQ